MLAEDGGSVKRVEQTGYSCLDGTRGRYGCIMACLASIFELPLTEVANPYFEWAKGEEHWLDGWAVIEEWFSERGFEAQLDDRGSVAPEGLWIAIVDSTRVEGGTHAVVFDGPEFVFDPASDEKVWTFDEVRWAYRWELAA